MTGTLTVVTYHYVRPLALSRFPAIKGLDLEEFDGQLAYMRQHYRFVSVDDVINAYDAGEPLPPRAALLTFDDGYIDHYTYVFPRLFEAGISGAFYPPRCSALDRRVLDVNKIHFVLTSCPDPWILCRRINDLVVAAQSEEGMPTLEQLRAEYLRPGRYDVAEVHYVKRLLQHALPEHVRSSAVDALFREFVTGDEAAFAEELYMTLPQMRTMAASGMHFGGHGVVHAWLDRLMEAEQAREIDGSADLLDRIGMPRDRFSFCYPFGGYARATIDLLRERGCRLAFSIAADLARVGRDDPLLIPRLNTNDLPKRGDAFPVSWTNLADG
ncbi:polysaccharide deacetylase family protein [Arenibaculum sp.]|jgi:peptidoglycan/xylan/chitin deacetylase (PgdA/CDA1 family)|uniref:polysaccharide deacetylase family protein n=1 Tax=Arenibaculum sp. TaxID=2865862 RepID=UPI002E0DD3F1|nr:polysaccharide deacetylase family protein [Arenibaculum sp.]